MPQLSMTALRAQLSSGDTDPLYVLLGSDEVEKAAVAGDFIDGVEEGLRAFNVDRLYGGDAGAVDAVIAAATMLPMMVPRRVVVVLEAEKMLAPKRETKAADADQQRLEALLADPAPQTTLVFVCGALDMRRRVVKLLVSKAQVVDCGTIGDEADAERWVKARAQREKATFDPAAVKALVDRTGLDLRRLRAGFERVTLYALGQPSISAEDVRQSVVAAPELQADFGIAKAIWRDDVREALRELDLVLEAGGVPVMIMGQLRAAAEKLPPARIPAAIDAVFRTDLALKSSGGEPRILLERLVVELCGTRKPGAGARAGGAGSYGGWRGR